MTIGDIATLARLVLGIEASPHSANPQGCDRFATCVDTDRIGHTFRCINIYLNVIIIEAETTSAGNGVGDKAIFGPGIGVLTSPKIPASAEYQFNIPTADNYEIYARYATEGARPVSLFLNGKMVNKDFCGNPTGGYDPAAQRWFAGGVFSLPAGKTTLRLESNGPFPHIDKIALVPMRSPK